MGPWGPWAPGAHCPLDPFALGALVTGTHWLLGPGALGTHWPLGPWPLVPGAHGPRKSNMRDHTGFIFIYRYEKGKLAFGMANKLTPGALSLAPGIFGIYFKPSVKIQSFEFLYKLSC